MNRKAIMLLSGGLDSTLAARMLREQNIEVEAVNFTSPFCNCSGRREGCRNQAVKVAEELNIPIRVMAKGLDYMKMVEKPPHGYGSQMNPCVDCRIYILRKAADLMKETGASFVATGEVLGQRPSSQQRHTLALIERESGLKNLILRPLSALHFAPTIPEIEGVVDRSQLLDIAGRGRKTQISLAAEWGVNDYPCPAGGCLLTDKAVAARLRDLFRYKPLYGMRDINLLVLGRHLRLNPQVKLVIGHNEPENKKIEMLADSFGTMVRPRSFRGPSALVDGDIDAPCRDTIGQLVASYCRDDLKSYHLESVRQDGGVENFEVDQKYPHEARANLLIGC